MTTHIIYADFISAKDDEEIESIQVSQLRVISREINACLVVVQASDALEQTNEYREKNLIIIKRRNIGYDFGSWNDALNLIDLGDNDQLVFLNSSLVGPLDLRLEFWDYVLDPSVDTFFVAASAQVSPHFQSYFWRINADVARNEKFRKFLSKPLSSNSRSSAIQDKELKLWELINELQCSYKVMFPLGSVCELDKNPSLAGWKRMYSSGFPFIKKSMIGDSTVREFLSQEGLHNLPAL